MVKNLVQVSFIQLIDTTGEKHHEERILGETFPFYPNYKEGETLFLRIIKKGQVDQPLPLTQFKIVGVHHSLMHILKNDRMYEVGTTSASIEVYLRKID